MPEDFDPYRKWLGIAPSEQPPHHYRLLGIAPFEDDPDVIQNAADRQMAHIRTYQGGPNRAHSQRILNELSAATIVLLDRTRKAEYDVQLHAKQAADDLLPPEATPYSPPGYVPLPAPPPPRREAVAAPPLMNAPPPMNAPAPPPMPPVGSLPPVAVPVAPAPLSAPAMPVVSKSRGASTVRARPRKKSNMVPMVVGLVAVGALLVGMLVFIVTQTEETGDTVVKTPKTPVTPPPEKTEPAPSVTPEKDPNKGTPTTPATIPGKKNEKSEPKPRPKNEPPKPPENASQPEKFKHALESARRHLSRRELEQAKIEVDNVEYLQMSVEDKEAARHLRQLYTSMDTFWNAVREGVFKKKKPGDVILHDDNELVLISTEGDMVKFRFNDKEHESAVLKLPTPVAAAFASEGLEKENPLSLTAMATFLALDGQMQAPARLDQAKKLWEQAASDGAKDLALANVLGLDEITIANVGKMTPDNSLPNTNPSASGGELPTARPDEAALRAVRDSFKTRYGDLIAKARNNQSEADALLNTMASELPAEKDPAIKYLMYENASELAADALRVDLILSLTDSMGQLWGIDTLQQKQRLLARCRVMTPESGEAVMNAAEALMTEAQGSDRLEVGVALGKLAVKAADKAKSKDIKPLQAKVREMEAWLDASNKAQAGRDALGKDANDPSAHGNIGRFLCYFKRDFDSGLGHLSQGNVEDEKKLATDDLAAPTFPSQQVELAERWYQLGKKKAGVARQSCYFRSQQWLDKALPQVNDDLKPAFDKLQMILTKELAPAPTT